MHGHQRFEDMLPASTSAGGALAACEKLRQIVHGRAASASAPVKRYVVRFAPHKN
jgi:hypothetical protein